MSWSVRVVRRDGTRCQHYDIHAGALRAQHSGIVPQCLFQKGLNGQLLTVLIEQDAQHVLTLDVGGTAQRKGGELPAQMALIRSTRVEPSAICSAMPRPTAAGSFLKMDSSQPAKLHSGWPLPSENR